MPLLVLWACGLGPYAQAASPASAREPTSPKAAQGIQGNTLPETESGILYGREAPVFDCDFGRVAFAICFDLNFDELRLKYVKAKPDLIVFSSVYHGGLMQAYWAYSCRAHFIGAVAELSRGNATLKSSSR